MNSVFDDEAVNLCHCPGGTRHDASRCLLKNLFGTVHATLEAWKRGQTTLLYSAGPPTVCQVSGGKHLPPVLHRNIIAHSWLMAHDIAGIEPTF